MRKTLRYFSAKIQSSLYVFADGKTTK